MTKTDVCNLALVKIGEKTITSIDDPNDKNARHAKIHYSQARDEALRTFFWSFALTTVLLAPEVALDSYDRVLDETTAEALGVDATYAAGAGNGGKPSWTNGDGDNLRWETAHVTYGAAWLLYDGASVLFYSNEDTATPELVETWTAVDGSGTPEFTTLLDDQRDAFTYAFALPSDFLKLKTVRNSSRQKIDAFAMQRANGKRCLLCGSDAIRMTYVQQIDTPTDYDPAFVSALVTLLASKLARAITGSDAMETQLLQRYEGIDLPAARTADGHDSQSAENHPLEEILAGNLTGARGSFGDYD